MLCLLFPEPPRDPARAARRAYADEKRNAYARRRPSEQKQKYIVFVRTVQQKQKGAEDSRCRAAQRYKRNNGAVTDGLRYGSALQYRHGKRI